MHIEFLIEDQSGKHMLEKLVPKIISDKEHTWRIIAYKGVGKGVPKNLGTSSETAMHRILLENLPRLLSGYGKAFQSYGTGYKAAVVVVCDLDRRDKNTFEAELSGLLSRCSCQPETRFCLAIEEGEAWFLGDIPAIRSAYPHCKMAVLTKYKNDSICGTWETLADAIYPGGADKLAQGGYRTVGEEKTRWSKNITPSMDIDNNASPSFCLFKDKVAALTQ